LLERPQTASSFPGARSLVAGKIEEGEVPEAAAVREVMEETKIEVSLPDASLPVVYVREKDTLWEVHPFLFKVNGAEPELNHENVGFEWRSPENIGEDGTIVTLTRKVVLDMLGL